MDNTTLDRRTAKELRELYDVTQAEIAEDARISPSKLSLYENGFANLTKKELQRLEKLLNALPEANAGKPGIKSLLDGTFAEQHASWSAKRRIKARRSFRRQAKLTQIELAREISIPPKKLRHWEANRLELSDAERVKWEQALIAAITKQRKADPWNSLEFRIHTMLEERRRWLPLLENLTSIDDPVIAEIIESFRREIAELEQQAKKPVVSDTQAD